MLSLATCLLSYRLRLMLSGRRTRLLSRLCRNRSWYIMMHVASSRHCFRFKRNFWYFWSSPLEHCDILRPLQPGARYPCGRPDQGAFARLLCALRFCALRNDFVLLSSHVQNLSPCQIAGSLGLRGHSEVSIRAPGIERSGLCLDNSWYSWRIVWNSAAPCLLLR